ncbi:MAG: TRAP transporter small permease [Gammaproteobacteria bacterium]|uniref:TRAP transporter small permease n=1 Tax=Pseudomaricurvus alcaniphilus TaxID=1166482 RepID=UPI001408E376|nr:TRAP transporter small permease [Pseudomaricurvus alcaniphilus]MBR9911436.1 TRAP transporter small permease [Gammaproteobacteria bacterium]NHN36810.1 TRAP transporter small permease [Pseudomaricurvus alcaniphilus]
MLSSLVNVLDRLFRVLLALLMATMVLCVTWQIVSRYLLGDPSPWTEELARFLLIWIGLLGGSFAYHVKMHLGLDLISAKFEGRARFWHEVFVHLLVIFFAATVLVAGGLSIVQLTAELQQHSAALGVSMSLVYCSLPISGVMLIFYAVIALVEAVRARRIDTAVSAAEVKS